jgi:hypothetical protein
LSIAKLTLIGMNNYDNSLFDNLKFENVDHETMVNTILLNCGEFEVLYPNIETLKNMFILFSNKWSRTVSKWVSALNTEYKPLENYDRYENFGGSETELENGSETHSTRGNETIINNGNTILSRSGTDNNNIENKTSAFNTSDYQPEEKTITQVNYGSSDKNDVNLNQTRTPNITETRTPDIKRTRTPNLENHIHGNIGVTTSQQMLESELKLQYWNLYNKISNLFMKEFCIMVY